MIHIGVDVGGTFTDVVAVEEGGRFWATKVPSTPLSPDEAVQAGTRKILEDAGAEAEAVKRFIHGTTVATNAIIERKGVTIGVLMTQGFEDTLEIGRYKRSRNYDLWFDVETPLFLAPRRRRKGIPERIAPDGSVLEPLDEEAVRQALRELVEEHGVEAIAVCYLFSFENADHERRTREIAGELYPELRVSLSSVVNPEVREYERLCVTAFDAYIGPVVERYLSRLAAELEEIGIEAPLQVMESRGGIADARLTRRRPSTTIMSGPAAGVVGALRAAAAAGYEEIVSIDIGGTSSDASLVADGRPLLSREGRILTYPVRTPMVDVNSIGAGGGSIAWFDVAGGLHVGPQSAGADPGPACYGRGGTEATVTDASVVLGYVDPAYFAGGSFALDADLGHEAVGRVASRLGVSPHEAAWGIHRIVNSNMTDQIRLISIGRGHDPRRFALVVLGGGGALHGCKLAEELGIRTIVVPALPGVLSAFGLLVSEVDYEQTRTVRVPVETVSGNGEASARVAEAFAAMDSSGRDVMSAQAVPAAEVVVDRFFDMRYVGQSYELEVPTEFGRNGTTAADIVRAFEEKHQRIYGHIRRGEPPEILNVRMIHRYKPPVVELAQPESLNTSVDDALKGSRGVYLGDLGGVETPVFERTLLPIGATIAGPAIVEQIDTTVVVHPGWTARVHPTGQLVVERG